MDRWKRIWSGGNQIAPERDPQEFMADEIMDDKVALTDEQLEARQNTDPSTDPADAPTVPTGSELDHDPVPGLPTLQEQCAQLKAERDQLFDRLARLQAEFDNARKRDQRERVEFRDYATGNVVEQFLPVLDNFSLALKSTGSIEQLRVGIELIVKQMEDVLRQLNVTAVDTVGTEFDPRVHEALESVVREDVPDHQVIDEVRRGYKIREKLLRPALVRVASNPNQKEA